MGCETVTGIAAKEMNIVDDFFSDALSYQHSKSLSSLRGNVWVLYKEGHLILVEKGVVFHAKESCTG